MSKNEKLKEGLDYYLNENQQMVFTAHFLTKRGFCCQSGCRHCPYSFSKNDPSVPIELQLNESNSESSSISYDDSYEDELKHHEQITEKT